MNGVGLAAFLLVALALVAGQLLRTNMLTERHVTLDSYIDGTAPRPFAYRALLPAIMRGINAVTPASAQPALDRLGERIAGLGMTRWRIQTGPQNKYPRDIFWLGLLQFASIVGYGLVAASLYLELCGEAGGNRWAVATAMLLFVAPIVFKGLGHIYDMTVLFFMACLLRAMASERFVLYLLVFAVSCVNKETTILMSIAFATVFFQRMETHRYVAMLAAQVVIFLAIYLTLRTMFIQNSGTSMEVHWHEEFGYYRSHLRNIYIIGIFCVAIILFLFLLTFRWSSKPPFLRRASLMIVPEMALFFYGGGLGEVRALYDILPLLSMLMLSSVASIFRIPPSGAVRAGT
jgi:hypothetical protein